MLVLITRSEGELTILNGRVDALVDEFQEELDSGIVRVFGIFVDTVSAPELIVHDEFPKQYRRVAVRVPYFCNGVDADMRFFFIAAVVGGKVGGTRCVSKIHECIRESMVMHLITNTICSM